MKIQYIDMLPHIEGHIHLAPSDYAQEAGSFELCARTHRATVGPYEPRRRAMHPLHHKLADEALGGKLRSIPVRVLFDTPEHNVHVRYQAWSDSYEHGPGCVGNGEAARRLDPQLGTWSHAVCRGPTLCPAVRHGTLRCSIEVRLRVVVDGQSDPLATWVVSSSSENSYRSLLGTLTHLRAMFAGLRHLPLELATYRMSTRASNFEAFDCIQVRMRQGISLAQAHNLAPAPNEHVERLGAVALAAWTTESEGEADQAAPTDVTAAMCSAVPADSATPRSAGSLFAIALSVARARATES